MADVVVCIACGRIMEAEAASGALIRCADCGRMNRRPTAEDRQDAAGRRRRGGGSAGMPELHRRPAAVVLAALAAALLAWAACLCTAGIPAAVAPGEVARRAIAPLWELAAWAWECVQQR